MVGAKTVNSETEKLLNGAFEHVLAEYGHRGYLFWKGLIGDQINFLFPTAEGRQVEVMPFWDKEANGRIRVAVSLLSVSFLGEPTKCFFVDPDGNIEV